jgi:hypothetical protein
MYGGRARHSDLVQVLFPSTLSYILPKRKPIQLEDHGAVIFGHNMFFKWVWKDTGHPEKGDLPSPPEESETPFHDSAIRPSVGSSTGESSDPLTDSNSSQQSSHRIPRKPLPVPPSHFEVDPQIGIADRYGDRNIFEARQIRLGKHPKPLISHMFNKLGRRRGRNVER